MGQQSFMNVDTLPRKSMEQPLVAPLGGLAKRALDIALALGALLFLFPVMVLLALLVKAADGGSPIYRHVRIGYRGQTFHCLKFRTMVPNSAEVLAKVLAESPEARREWDATQKLRNDPRITWIGRVLRVTSLDELPQLLNVLAGDMSIVGPRPIVRAEVKRYGQHFARYALARPGITGQWQVSGRSDTSYERRVRLDVDYVDDWSIRRDLKICVQTVGVVIARSGSY